MTTEAYMILTMQIAVVLTIAVIALLVKVEITGYREAVRKVNKLRRDNNAKRL